MRCLTIIQNTFEQLTKSHQVRFLFLAAVAHLGNSGAKASQFGARLSNPLRNAVVLRVRSLDVSPQF